MRRICYFLFTCLLSFFGFCGALGARDNPWPGFAVAFGVWIIFFWRLHLRNKKEAMRRQYDEWMFSEYMRWRDRQNR